MAKRRLSMRSAALVRWLYYVPHPWTDETYTMQELATKFKCSKITISRVINQLSPYEYRSYKGEYGPDCKLRPEDWPIDPLHIDPGKRNPPAV